MITDMSGLFFEATAFNGDISKWVVSSVTRMHAIFNAAATFNGDISEWDVSKVTGMDSMFAAATAFNGDISEWDVSSATYMNGMFRDTTAFNGDISKWDVSSVINMQSMFERATAFNGDISNWDVSSVLNMGSMLYYATAFEQTTLCWDLTSVSETRSMFDGSSGGLGNINDPKCGKCVATTVDIMGRLHRLPLQCTKKRALSMMRMTTMTSKLFLLLLCLTYSLFCTQVKDDDESSQTTITDSPTNAPSSAPVGWTNRRGVRLVVGLTLLVAPIVSVRIFRNTPR
jgi:surface protein